ncbi:MAG TPA: F0F1 ATP synthase subunit A [Ktedonobacterales bacterium]
MPWSLPHIAVPVDTLFKIGDFPVTNTFIVTWVTIFIMLGFFYAALRNPRLVPRKVQNLVEWVVELLLNLCEEVAGKENGRRFFPWVATIFLFVLLANWWEVIPGVETIGLISKEFANCHNVQPVAGIFLWGSTSNCLTPWLRPPSTDLNLTIAISVISVFMTQVYGFRRLGVIQHVTKYLNYREGVLGIVIGLLEFVLEMIRVVSFSFRLFGNLFAGDVLLLVMAFLVPVLASTPFYFLEIFVGFIQAFVFAMLTLVFMTLSVTPHEHAEHEEHEEHREQPAPSEAATVA